jgi:hypothetical protein
MKRYSDTQIEEARLLRIKNHYSFAQLSKITGIPSTTIRNWCADDFIGSRQDTLLFTNERKRIELKSTDKYIVKSIDKIDSKSAKIYTSLLYWCEGTKYPASNKMEFSNSDPVLQVFFISLLRKAYSLDESKFRIHLQIHNTHDYEKIKNFWSKLLIIPASQFIKPTITNMKGRKHRKNYMGTCALRYNDFRLKLRLIGLYEEMGLRIGGVATQGDYPHGGVA